MNVSRRQGPFIAATEGCLFGALIVAAIACSVVANPAPAHAVDVSLSLGGGTILPWGASDEIGNAFGGGVFLGFEDLELGLVGAVVLPDSRVQARFGTLWLEARYHPFGRDCLLSPYGAVGFGFATGDDFTPGTLDPAPPRWTSSGASPLGLLGVGLRYGAERGLGLALDLRLYNHTHGGINILASYRF